MKEKISITIDAELIKQADAMIDGITVRNRSQALESLLRKALTEKAIDSAVILAGGKLKNLEFEGTYRPLVKIEGAPVIVNSIRKLKEAGVTKIVIAAGPITEKIFELVGDGSEYGVNITYVQDRELGTAGAVKAAEKHIRGSFFVLFADIYFDFDLNKMVGFHRANRGLATIAVSVTELGESLDFIKIVGNKITEFQYQVGKARTHHVNAGIYLFEKDALARVPKRGSLEKDLLPKLAKEGRLTAFVFSGNWKHLK